MSEQKREKHKKSFNAPLDKSELLSTMDRLVQCILRLGYKQQHLLNTWLNKWTMYLNGEKDFDPNRLRFYKRGEIVYVDFGYNVGNELGGLHYAIVIENNNNKSNGLLVVIPISSLEIISDKEQLHKSEVYLGKAIGDVESYAKTLQIRAISKQRIVWPKYKGQKIGNVTNEVLAEIERKISTYFLKPNK